MRKTFNIDQQEAEKLPKTKRKLYFWTPCNMLDGWNMKEQFSEALASLELGMPLSQSPSHIYVLEMGGTTGS